MIDGLNRYSGRAPETAASGLPGGGLARELREQAESRIAAVVACQQLPADTPAPAAAFRELLRGRDLYGHESSGGQNIAPYRFASDISMPDSVHDAPSVASLLAGADFYLGDGLEQMLRPDSKRDARDEDISHQAACRPRPTSASAEVYCSGEASGQQRPFSFAASRGGEEHRRSFLRPETQI